MQYEDDDSGVLCLDIPIQTSSLISKLEYDEFRGILTVYLRYSKYPVSYEGVSTNHFDEFLTQQSIGKYYLNFIKPNFKQVKTRIMDKQKPKGVNIASDKVRWIDLSIDVTKIKKEWLVEGQKGTYLNTRLRMLPDGQVDQFECLGFIVQNVPSEIYKAAEAKEKGSGKLIEGVILGNAKELVWGDRNIEGLPGSTEGTLGSSNDNDLPF